jgi:4-methylaminobutanoate oxidase (formaldehyde-forming)
VQGPDAEALLQSLCANDVGVSPDRIVYTGMLNEQGGYESDLTVTRVAPDAYLVVTGSGQRTRDLDWIRRHTPEAARVTVTDVTEAWAVLGLMGPRSRELLSRVSGAALDGAAFPFGASREIAIGPATRRARIDE